MQFFTIFATLLLSTAVAAKGNSTKPQSEKELCREISLLNVVVKLAANQTKLAEKTKNNATKIAEFQAKASEASTKLTTLSSNATLTSACAVIDASKKTKSQCKEMKFLTEFVDIAGNATLLASKTKNNSTKIAAIQAKASSVKTKLDALTSNTTLADICKSTKTSKNKNPAASASESAPPSNGLVSANGASRDSDPRASLISAMAVIVVGMMLL